MRRLINPCIRPLPPSFGGQGCFMFIQENSEGPLARCELQD